MPVDDYPVHPHGQRSVPLAGCYNKPRTVPPLQVWDIDTVRNPDGSFSRIPKVRWIEHTMSTKCRQIVVLPECEGCTSEKDEEYIEKMRGVK